MISTATPRAGTVVNLNSQPCAAATVGDYPLYATCEHCEHKIRCMDATADWTHTRDYRPTCPYKSQAARDAQATGYGGSSYWDELDSSAQRAHDYYAARGDTELAAAMFTRSLSEALQGNDGD